MAGDINKSVKIAINIVNGVGKQVGSIVTSFGKLTDSVNKATTAVGNLNTKLSKLKTPSGLSKLGTDLQSISKVDGKGIGTISTGLNKLSNIKFPSFGTVNTDLAQHAKRLKEVVQAYNSLATATKGVNLKNVTSNINKGSTSIKNLTARTKESGTSFSQWGFALGSASTGLSKFGTQIYGVTRGFSAVSKELGASMLIFTGAFSAMFAVKGIVSDLVQFDDAIRSAGAVASASAVDMQLFTDAARNMGEYTRYTATEAAEALKALAMTGLNVTEAIGSLPTVLNLAAAANMDLGQSADIATNIMVGYGKSVADLPHIADLMTAAFTSSNTSLEQAGVALKYVGPVAKAAGLEIEETTGLIASLANAGYRGSKAGTTLRTAFTNILSPTKKMSDALSNYNIQVEDMVKPNGTLKSFTGLLGVMEKKGITAGDAMTIFGKRAGPGMLALLDQGLPALEKMNQKMAEAEGLSIKVAYEMEAGLGGSLRKLRSMWQEVSLSIGDVIATDVNDFIKALTTTLKENKEQLVEVASAVFEFLGVLAKLSGWTISFLASNAKVIAGLGALALAIKFVATESKVLLGVNVAGMFTNLAGNVNFKKLNNSIQLLAIGMETYTKAAKDGVAVGIGQSIAAQFKGTSSAAGAIKTLGASVATFIVSTGKAIATFVKLNKWMLIITAAVGLLIWATRDTSVNFNELSEETNKLAKATAESTRELSYQVAELKLINAELNREGATDFLNAEQRLTTALKNSNISLSDKVRLMELVAKGGDNYNTVAKELLKLTEEEKALNDAKEQKLRIKSIKEKTQALEDQAKKIAKTYDIEVEAIGKVADAEILALKTVAAGYEVYGTKGMSTGQVGADKAAKERLEGLSEELDAYNEIKFELSALGETYNAFQVQAILAGKSVEDFVTQLKQTGKSDAEVEILVKGFKELEDQVANNEKGQRFLSEAGTMTANKLRAVNQDRIQEYKDGEEEREKATLAAIRKIILAEAAHDITAAQAIEEKARINKEALDENLVEAKATREKINFIDQKGFEDSQKIITELEKQGAKDRFNIEKDRIVNAKSLNKELETISNNLLAKRVANIKTRAAMELAAADKIRAINASGEERLRIIRQRSMTEDEKDNDNRIEGVRRLSEAERLYSEGVAEGNVNKLKQSEQAFKDAGAMANSIKGQALASKLVRGEMEGLSKIVSATINLQKNGQDEVSAKDTKNAATSVKNAKTKYGVITKADNALTSQRIKNIKSITKESEASAKTEWEKINGIWELVAKKDKTVNKERVDNAKEVTKEIAEGASELSKLPNEFVFFMKGSTNSGEQKPLDESINDLTESLWGISEDVNVTVDIKDQDGKEVETKVDEISTKVAELKVEIPVTVNNEQLQEILTMVAEINRSDINIIVKVDSGEAVTFKLLYDSFTPKTVKITADFLSMFKWENALDTYKELKSKDVYIKAHYSESGSKSSGIAAKADGGIINGPEHYATGGNVFSRLKNRFIGSGGGKKDDVPAMLMKGEFVQKVSAVKKYGKDFMSRLNAGMIPQSVAKMFNQGGDVQPEHYASGGHVGFGRKKKLEEELLGKRKQLAGTMNLNINNKLDSGGYTPGGIEAMISLKNVIGDSISSFAGGGSLLNSASLKDVAGNLDSDYSAKVSAAKKGGDSELAAILKKEQDDLRVLSKELSSDLKELEDEYLLFKKDTTLEHEERTAEIKETFADDGETLDSTHADALETLREEYLDNIMSIDDTQADADSQYAEAKSAYETDRASLITEKQSAKVEGAIAYSEAMLSGNQLGDTISRFLGIKNVNEAKALRLKSDNMESAKNHGYRAGQRTHAGSFTMDEIQAQMKQMEGTYRSNADGSPNFKQMKSELVRMFPELKGAISGDPTGVGGFKTSSFAYASSGASVTNKTTGATESSGTYQWQDKDGNEVKQGTKGAKQVDISGQKILDDEGNQKQIKTGEKSYTSSVAYKTTSDGMEWAKSILSLESSIKENNPTTIGKAYDKQISSLKTAINETALSYEKDRLRNAEERVDTTTSYDGSVADENESYNKQKSDYQSSYDKSLKAEDKSYLSSIKDANKSYKAESKKLNETFNSATSDIKSTALSDKNAVKESMAVDLEGLKSALASETSSASSSTEPVSTASRATSVEELFKKLGIRGYNTGGHIGSTPTSVNGKDSILAAVAPNEYVMQASVVRKYGKGFFDALNSFQIPHFNTGGVVEGIGTNLINASNSSQSVVKHMLDLSINGQKQGELTGSPMTIDKILNDLTLAKMRS